MHCYNTSWFLQRLTTPLNTKDILIQNVSKHIVAILMVIIFEAYMTHGLLHVCVHVYMAYMCEGVGERVCWFDEAIGGMLVEMNLGSRGGGGGCG